MKPPVPPEYVAASDVPGQTCSGCEMFWKGRCWGFANADVEAKGWCRNWTKDPSGSARNAVR